MDYLERFIESGIKRAKALQPTLTHSDMVREAKLIEKASLKLKSRIDKFEDNYFDAQCENHKWRADSFLEGLADKELEIARIAYSKYSCQYVLLGIAMRMRALQTPGKSGKKDILGRWLKQEVEYVFNKEGLPTGMSNDFIQALDHAIKLAGIKSSASSLTKTRTKP